QIPKGYPQEQGKVEAYNKIVIAEFLQIEELKDEKDGAEKYEYTHIHNTITTIINTNTASEYDNRTKSRRSIQ
ncbi:MAG: hypothetical protein WBF33_08030, partial [Candidatus Nitrosopolaris sp.]